MSDVFDWLQSWYLSQCDGDWEHIYGIHIDTLDNPGWSVNIDLAGTELEGRTFNELRQEVDESNWIVCRVDHAKFLGWGGPRNLREILEVFRGWAEGNTEQPAPS